MELKNSKLPIPFGITDEEISVLTPPAGLDMVAWAEENFSLSEMTSEIPGPWSPEYTPYLVEPLVNLSAAGPVEEWLCACTQSGKTTASLIFTGFTIDQRPAPLIFVMPREDDAKRRVRTRIKPMFTANKDLLRHAGGGVNNINIDSETVLDNMIMYLAWAGSAAALADNPVCNVILDEVGKFPFSVGKEAGPVELIRKRQRTFRLRAKLLGLSSPVLAGDVFDTEYESGDKRQWFVCCPYCKKFHKLIFENVIIDKDKNGGFFEQQAYRAGGLARYVCPKCHAPWTEVDRQKANRLENARWVPHVCGLTDDGKLVGPEPAGHVHSRRVHALMLHPRFQTIDDLAAQWVKADFEKKKGNIKPLQDFCNSQLAQPFKQVGKIIVADKLLAKRNKYSSGEVPEDVRLLTAGADYHEDEMGNVTIYYEIRGFAAGLKNYVILADVASDFDELSEIVLMREYGQLAVVCMFIDSGYQADKVYRYCRKFPGIVFPTKGADFQKTPFLVNDLDKIVERAKKRIRRRYSSMFRGMQLITLHTNYFKDIVTSWAEAPMGEAGSTEFCRDIPPHYFELFTNEHKVKKKKGNYEVFVWEPKTDNAASHTLDTAVQSAAAGFWMKAQDIRRADEAPKIPAAIRKQREKRTPAAAVRRKRSAGGFLDDMPKL